MKWLCKSWKIFHKWAQGTILVSYTYFSTRDEKIFFLSPSGHVLFYLSYKHQWNTKLLHFNIFLLRKMQYIFFTIATVIFAHMKIAYYFYIQGEDIMFLCESTWHFIGVKWYIERILHGLTEIQNFSLSFELKNISRVSTVNERNIFQHEKRNFVSQSSHVMFHLSYKHQWKSKPFHLNIFCYKWCDLLCICSNGVHMWRYHVFVQKLTWYFISVCIIIFLVLFLSDWNILGRSGGSRPWSEYPRETVKIRLSPSLPLIYLLLTSLGIYFSILQCIVDEQKQLNKVLI